MFLQLFICTNFYIALLDGGSEEQYEPYGDHDEPDKNDHDQPCLFSQMEQSS